jgi:hypothetical protein
VDSLKTLRNFVLTWFLRGYLVLPSAVGLVADVTSSFQHGNLRAPPYATDEGTTQ